MNAIFAISMWPSLVPMATVIAVLLYVTCGLLAKSGREALQNVVAAIAGAILVQTIVGVIADSNVGGFFDRNFNGSMLFAVLLGLPLGILAVVLVRIATRRQTSSRA